MRIALADADDDGLASFAQHVSTQLVDPTGIDDHSWLYGDPRDVLAQLRAARDRRVGAGGVAWIVTVDEGVVGFVSARVDGEVAETFSVVAADMQHRGIGGEARRAALNRLRKLGVKRAVSVSRPRSASSAISRRLGYRYVGIEVRTAPDGTDVELERWELDI